MEEEKLLIAVESSVKEKGEQKELWREEAVNCRSARFPEFIHELSFSSVRGTGCRLR